MRDAPNPGTDAALKLGCTCPVIDNCYGKGYRGQEGVFAYVVSCPVHDAIAKALKKVLS